MDEAKYRARLIARKAELEDLSSTSAQGRAAVDLDQSKVGRLSRMDALQQQAMENAVESRRRQELLKIEAAMHRLDDGSFGECLRCGEDIADARLEINPSATLCRNCAE